MNKDIITFLWCVFYSK